MADITISVVSHRQMALVVVLLQDLAINCRETRMNVILTLNVPEELPVLLDHLPYPLRVLCNDNPLGFGENHNRAFRHARTPFFCVINPDIRIESNIFPVLINDLKDRTLGVVAPRIVNAAGVVEDSARKFPTPFKIFCKLFGGCKMQDYPMGGVALEPDWVGGMFMVFRRDVYERLGGFDQRFFLYYEDVDLCARIRLAGLRVLMLPGVSATHLARRSSHRRVVYSMLHIRSMLRFFSSKVFMKVMWRGFP